MSPFATNTFFVPCAWCYGRGGPWRDAVEQLVDEVVEL